MKTLLFSQPSHLSHSKLCATFVLSYMSYITFQAVPLTCHPTFHDMRYILFLMFKKTCLDDEKVVILMMSVPKNSIMSKVINGEREKIKCYIQVLVFYFTGWHIKSLTCPSCGCLLYTFFRCCGEGVEALHCLDGLFTVSQHEAGVAPLYFMYTERVEQAEMVAESVAVLIHLKVKERSVNFLHCCRV